jgi:hypothetical protein
MIQALTACNLKMKEKLPSGSFSFCRVFAASFISYTVINSSKKLTDTKLTCLQLYCSFVGNFAIDKQVCTNRQTVHESLIRK